MKTNRLIFAALACISMSAMLSCSDLSGIEDRLDTLESEVDANTTQISSLVSNQETLAELKALIGTIFINKVEETDEVITLTLSNGQILTIKKEADGSTAGIEGIVAKNGKLEITISETEIVEVPIVSGFVFAVTKNGKAISGVQKIEKGGSIEFSVEQKGVASAAVVACPAEFKVALTDTRLTVNSLEEATAGAALKTRATADSSTDIAILAVSVNGLSVLFKLQLEVVAPGEGGNEDGGEDDGGNDGGETVPTNDYEKYMAGQDITIGSITINKSVYGDATLISNDSENKVIESTGVYFVDSAAEGVSIKSDAEKLVILSLDEKGATVTRGGQTAFVATDATDYFIASNIRYITTQTTGNVFGAKGDGDFETILFNKVQIEIPAGMNMIYSAKNIVNFSMTDCDVKLHKGSDVKNILQTNTTNTYASVVFKNNIFYCTDTDGTLSNFGLFTNNNATIASLEFRNNTIAGVYCKATSGYISAKEIKAGDVVSNLFYVPEYSTLIPDKYVGILWLPNGYDDSHLDAAIKSNLAYYSDDAVPTYRIKGTYYGSKGQIYNKAKADNPIPAPDYANGVFTQGENYKSFGAKR